MDYSLIHKMSNIKYKIQGNIVTNKINIIVSSNIIQLLHNTQP